MALRRMEDAAEMLWITLANVSGGDWTQQSAEWQEAAARWRDKYFDALQAVPVSSLVIEEAPTDVRQQLDILINRADNGYAVDAEDLQNVLSAYEREEAPTPDLTDRT
jgi:hypothetical protein